MYKIIFYKNNNDKSEVNEYIQKLSMRKKIVKMLK